MQQNHSVMTDVFIIKRTMLHANPMYIVPFTINTSKCSEGALYGFLRNNEKLAQSDKNC